MLHFVQAALLSENKSPTYVQLTVNSIQKIDVAFHRHAASEFLTKAPTFGIKYGRCRAHLVHVRVVIFDLFYGLLANYIEKMCFGSVDDRFLNLESSIYVLPSPSSSLLDNAYVGLYYVPSVYFMTINNIHYVCTCPENCLQSHLISSINLPIQSSPFQCWWTTDKTLLWHQFSRCKITFSSLKQLRYSGIKTTAPFYCVVGEC